MKESFHEVKMGVIYVDLQIGKRYKIKRTQTPYGARKRKIFWIEGTLIKMNDKFITFDLGDNREFDIATEDADEKLMEG